MTDPDCPPESRAFHEAYRIEEAAARPTGAFAHIGDVLPAACTADRLWAHREAKVEGRAAYAAGESSANKYPLGRVAHSGWEVGWHAAEREALPRQSDLFHNPTPETP